MSRTRKDEPYFVKAKKKGKVEHDYRCATHVAVGTHTKVETKIFYAHEVEEMSTLEKDLAEAGDKFSVKEIAGYLVTQTSARYSRYNWMNRSKGSFVPTRVLVDTEYHHAKYYDDTELGNGMYYSPEHTVSEFNVFYVYSITRTKTFKNRGYGPREDMECCSPQLPYYLFPHECDWCCPDRSGEIARMNASLQLMEKNFNSLGVIDPNEELYEGELVDFLETDDLNALGVDFADDAPNLVYTSETPRRELLS